MKILFFDNYDSFTFNLVHYLKEIGAEVVVKEQKDIEVKTALIDEFDAIVIGPGPKSPKESGKLMDFLGLCVNTKIPVLGVCLGHQALGELLGLKLMHARIPIHGKASVLNHLGIDIFEGISNPMSIGRYHSLVVEGMEIESKILILMTDEYGQIMAFKSLEWPLWGIQFHPESVLTPEGKQLLRNWMDLIS